ncbi:MAG: OmpH family outer membrane protein [Stenotrophobium sp.]
MKKMNHLSKALIGAAAGAALLMSGAAMADVKIATINLDDIVLQSPQYKDGQDKMKAEFGKRQSDLATDAKKFQDDVKNFQKNGDLMSAADKAKTEKDLGTRQVDLSYRQHQLQEDFQTRDKQLTSDMMNQIKAIIVKVAKDKNYDVVLQDPVYATPAVDISAEVLKRLQAADKQ